MNPILASSTVLFTIRFSLVFGMLAATLVIKRDTASFLP